MKLLTAPPSRRKPRTTARFLFMHNGGLVTTIKLRPGQDVVHHEWNDNGEGTECITRCWQFDGHVVRLAWQRDGSDCDGRMASEGISECPQRDLRAGYCDAEGNRWPRWMPVWGGQRDYAAEATGY